MTRVTLKKNVDGRLWRGVWATRLRWAQLLTHRRNEQTGRRMMFLALGRMMALPPSQRFESVRNLHYGCINTVATHNSTTGETIVVMSFKERHRRQVAQQRPAAPAEPDDPRNAPPTPTPPSSPPPEGQEPARWGELALMPLGVAPPPQSLTIGPAGFWGYRDGNYVPRGPPTPPNARMPFEGEVGWRIQQRMQHRP